MVVIDAKITTARANREFDSRSGIVQVMFGMLLRTVHHVCKSRTGGTPGAQHPGPPRLSPPIKERAGKIGAHIDARRWAGLCCPFASFQPGKTFGAFRRCSRCAKPSTWWPLQLWSPSSQACWWCRRLSRLASSPGWRWVAKWSFT